MSTISLNTALKKLVRFISPYTVFLEKRLKLLENKIHTLSLDIANDKYLKCLEDKIGKIHVQEKIIVSLTSYSKRIENVHLTIASLLKQSVQADMIILWLSSEECISEKLAFLEANYDNFEIRFCADMKSYKKLIPTLCEFETELIITADDDIIYPYFFVEKLLVAHINDPSHLHCYRAHKIKLNRNGSTKPYSKWDYETNDSLASHLILPTSGAGVIFKRNMLHEDATNYELASRLSPTADDLWLKVMAFANNTMCKVIEGNLMVGFITIDHDEVQPLSKLNVTLKKNDKYIKALMSYYKIEFDILDEDSD